MKIAQTFNGSKTDKIVSNLQQRWNCFQSTTKMKSGWCFSSFYPRMMNCLGWIEKYAVHFPFNLFSGSKREFSFILEYVHLLVLENDRWNALQHAWCELGFWRIQKKSASWSSCTFSNVNWFPSCSWIWFSEFPVGKERGRRRRQQKENNKKRKNWNRLPSLKINIHKHIIVQNIRISYISVAGISN